MMELMTEYPAAPSSASVVLGSLSEVRTPHVLHVVAPYLHWWHLPEPSLAFWVESLPANVEGGFLVWAQLSCASAPLKFPAGV